MSIAIESSRYKYPNKSSSISFRSTFFRKYFLCLCNQTGFNYINITNSPTTAMYLNLYVTYIIGLHKGILESLGFWILQHWIPESKD